MARQARRSGLSARRPYVRKSLVCEQIITDLAIAGEQCRDRSRGPPRPPLLEGAHGDLYDGLVALLDHPGSPCMQMLTSISVHGLPATTDALDVAACRPTTVCESSTVETGELSLLAGSGSRKKPHGHRQHRGCAARFHRALQHIRMLGSRSNTLRGTSPARRCRTRTRRAAHTGECGRPAGHPPTSRGPDRQTRAQRRAATWDSRIWPCSGRGCLRQPRGAETVTSRGVIRGCLESAVSKLL